MPRTTVISRGFAVATGPIPKYKGHSLPPEAIYDFAQRIREGNFPLGIEHDRRHQLDYKVHLVEVRRTKDGELGVWVEVEVDEADREKIENKKGFSASFLATFHSPDPADTKPKLSIAIDPAHFDEEDIQATVKELEQYFAVEASYLYQLSDEITIIGVIVNIAEQLVGNVFSAGICAGLQRLFSKSKGDQLSELIVEYPNKKITLKTNDEKLIERQLNKLIPSERSSKKRNKHKQIAQRQTATHFKKSRRRKSH